MGIDLDLGCLYPSMRIVANAVHAMRRDVRCALVEFYKVTTRRHDEMALLEEES